MFEKKKLSFANKKIFGYSFKNTLDNCFFRVSKMLFSGKIEPNGMIDKSQADAFKLSELWSYIYYLYYYNNSDIEEFKLMKTAKTGLADAVMFYNVVKTVVNREYYDLISSNDELHIFNPLSLIKFINYIIVAHKDELVNPVFDYLQILINDKILTNMNGIKLVTGKNSSSIFDIVNSKNTKAHNAANIKIGFISDK